MNFKCQIVSINSIGTENTPVCVRRFEPATSHHCACNTKETFSINYERSTSVVFIENTEEMIKWYYMHNCRF